jgi:hypothetical protein
MSATGASSEKASSPPTGLGPLSGLELKPSDKLDSTFASPEKSPSPDVRITAPVEDDPNPVSFFTLFRSVLVTSTYSFVILILSSDSPLAQSSSSMVSLLSQQQLRVPPRCVPNPPPLPHACQTFLTDG